MKVNGRVKAVFAAIIILFGCNKENSIDNPTPSGTSGNDSTLILKYIELDTTATSIDTVLKKTYTYDNLKRVQRIDVLEYPDFYQEYYFYSGNDTLPNKYVYKFMNDTDTSFLTYNSTGLIIRDSIATSFATTAGMVKYRSSFYNITVDTVKRFYKGYQSNGILLYKDTSVFLQTRSGNLITQEKAKWRGLSDTLRHRLVFDNKKNPIYRDKIKYPYITDTNSGDADPQMYNYTDDYFSTFSHLKYTYKYNSNDLPKEASVIELMNSGRTAYPNKVLYYYTK
jgi:hypothetical protein